MARSESDPPVVVASSVGAFFEAARLLGRRIAELHRALASDGDDPAFTPEPFGPLEQRALYQAVRTAVGRVFRRLRAGVAGLPADAAEAVARLLGREADVLDACRPLVGAPLGGKRIRCHGDLHLGQILRAGGDFVVIDFEGEPQRSLGERRLKRSPLADVAGMLRSLQYAGQTALRHARERGTVGPDALPRMLPWTAAWHAWVGGAFLRSYLEHVASSGLLPRTARETELLLRVLLVEKGVYEIGYELDHRPDWIRIPVDGLLGLVDDVVG
jgi:maltose alpha-D-glucosyltransferase/alpha-amylase